jgi:hypothetical protein
MSGIFSTEHVNETMNSSIADPRPIATSDELQKAVPMRDALRYVKNDTYIADASAILGQVYYERINDDTLIPFYLSIGAQVDPNSKLSAPQTVSELIIDKKAKAKVEALSLLNVELSAEELLEVRVINNSIARLVLKGDEWEAAITKWLRNPLCQDLISDSTVGRIAVVTGAVQKYFTTKKYKKFEAGAKGGAWGVNVEGSLYTSTSQFSLEVVYGLDLVTFKQAANVNEFAENLVRRALETDRVGLQSFNAKFSKMVESQASVFRPSDRPNF